MRNTSALTLLILVLSMAGGLHARQEAFAIDVVGIGLVPAASYKSDVGPGLGALVGFELETVPSFALTGRGGYIGHMGRNEYSRSVVPILGGLKITSYNSSLYIAGEIGRASIRDGYDGSDSTFSDRRASRTAWGIGFGSAVDRLDLRFSLHAWDAEKPRDSMTIGLSIGFLLLSSY
jgi:hypothetical protein